MHQNIPAAHIFSMLIQLGTLYVKCFSALAPPHRPLRTATSSRVTANYIAVKVSIDKRQSVDLEFSGLLVWNDTYIESIKRARLSLWMNDDSMMCGKHQWKPWAAVSVRRPQQQKYAAYRAAGVWWSSRCCQGNLKLTRNLWCTSRHIIELRTMHRNAQHMVSPFKVTPVYALSPSKLLHLTAISRMTDRLRGGNSLPLLEMVERIYDSHGQYGFAWLTVNWLRCGHCAPRVIFVYAFGFHENEERARQRNWWLIASACLPLTPRGRVTYKYTQTPILVPPMPEPENTPHLHRIHSTGLKRSMIEHEASWALYGSLYSFRIRSSFVLKVNGPFTFCLRCCGVQRSVCELMTICGYEERYSLCE